jgi:hypothetical protein
MIKEGPVQGPLLFERSYNMYLRGAINDINKYIILPIDDNNNCYLGVAEL